MALCSTRFLLLLFLLSGVPLSYIIHSETSDRAAHVYAYASKSWLREPPLHRLLLRGRRRGGPSRRRRRHFGGDYGGRRCRLREELVTGNRLLVAIADAQGNKYNAVAAYDLTTWNRLFHTKLAGPEGEKTFADDVAVDTKGNAYVTDVKESKIWKVGVNGELLYTIKSPLFIPKEWYYKLIGLNGFVYHPNGYLLVVHTLWGKLFKIAIAGNAIRLVESTDDWETARIVGKSKAFVHRLVTAATVKEGKVYLNHLVGFGYPKRKHVLVEAIFI
ncbi:hypothetical protein AAHA92_20875 [Salvia divinorum]|uniref:Uncharacterized protein n=1 Tax=Salvia divinorum TaxID=28513 RepID=A0ABD1GIL3_SALDI